MRKHRARVALHGGCEAEIDLSTLGDLLLFNHLGYIESIGCDENGLVIGFRGLKFRGFYYSFYEVFVKEIYNIDVSGRDVVDVGAFTGDSSIYFAVKGARRVVAIEPHPYAFREMVENIKLNRLEDRIVPLNKAIGSGGFLEPPAEAPLGHISCKIYRRRHRPYQSVVKVEKVTLVDVVKNTGIEPEVLKMDCEGCECEAIMSDYEGVRLFDTLVIEIHEDVCSKEELVRILSRDYRCTSSGDLILCSRRGGLV